jgi:pyruvate dehydrogenase E2 component (dihydrolipoamide acetyltransferase)
VLPSFHQQSPNMSAFFMPLTKKANGVNTNFMTCAKLMDSASRSSLDVGENKPLCAIHQTVLTQEICMPIELKMPALSPTMEEGTLARWFVKEGDTVSSGDLLAEIETDKATMEFEAVDEGVVEKILIGEGTDGVKVGTVIALIAGEDEPAAPVKAAAPVSAPVEAAPAPAPAAKAAPTPTPKSASGDRIKASPLAKRIAADKGIDLSTITGSGPNGRIVKADVENATGSAPAVQSVSASPAVIPSAATAPVVAPVPDFGIPHSVEKLSNMRKTIARRLTESKQQVPHIYLTVDVRLDALLKLRTELNAALENQGVKLSVNDMLIKALAKALVAVPKCNVSFAGDTMLQYERADISVAVSIPTGLITPIITDASSKSISAISTEMAALAGKAKEGKLQPHEYQGGTASLSNMGMMGIKHFEAVINPPQGMIMAIGAGEKRPYVVDDALAIATVMSATGSFDHRAIDGADGAQLMKVFKELVEKPLGLVA